MVERTNRIRSAPIIQAVHGGLGATLPEGYEVKDRVVVDENHTQESVGSGSNVIHKLIAGFKSFKEAKFKYVMAYGCQP